MSHTFSSLRKSVRALSLTGWAFVASVLVVLLSFVDVGLQVYGH